MKTKVLSLVFVFLLGTVSVFAKDKTEKFKVYGNCGMCEKRIEKAANQLEGVSSADWNKETKMIQVVLDDSKTDVHKVQTAIAKAGHDTDMHKAKDEAYDKLPDCCKYDRSGDAKGEKHSDHSGHTH
jgi:copper chaperone CopZ